MHTFCASRSLAALAAAVAAGVTAGVALREPQGAPPAPPSATTSTAPVAEGDAAKFSYGIGFDLGMKTRLGLASDAQSADAALILSGFADGLAGRPPVHPQAEIDRVLRGVHARMLEKTAQQRYASDPEFKALADANAARSAEAMKGFAGLAGVKELEEGVLHQVVDAGSGASIGPDDLVVADYAVMTTDGREADRAKRVVIDPKAMVPRAGRVLSRMRVGDHWIVAFASDQAYGLGGDPPRIGPNEALLVDIRVIETRPRDSAAVAPNPPATPPAPAKPADGSTGGGR